MGGFNVARTGGGGVLYPINRLRDDAPMLLSAANPSIQYNVSALARPCPLFVGPALCRRAAPVRFMSHERLFRSGRRWPAVAAWSAAAARDIPVCAPYTKP